MKSRAMRALLVVILTALAVIGSAFVISATQVCLEELSAIL